MFKFLPLLWANLKRRKLRLVFTLASIVVAFLMFGLLEAMRYAFGMGVDLAGVDRLMLQNKVSIIQPLPYAYGNRIRGLKGVKRVSNASWFGGTYQNERQQVVLIPVEGQQYLEMYPEMTMPEDQKRAWLANRTGALVGKALMDQYQWQVGQTVPVRSTFWRKADGGDTWDLSIDGVYDLAKGGDTRGMIMHYEYFNEPRAPGQKDLVGWYILQVDDPQASPEIARQLDAMFANSSAETRTTTEKAMMQQWANQVGNIGAILIAVATAVFFTMLLVTANTMGQSVRERTNELAVLKTLGFRGGQVMTLVLMEAVFITVLGGAVGLGLALMLAKGMGPALEQYLPLFRVPSSSIAAAVVLMLTLGLLAGVLPAAQALRLRIVEALRKS